MINEKELQNIKWNDVSITRINKDSAVLIIMMFDTFENGNKFFENILSKNEFRFEALKNKDNDRYQLRITFVESDWVILYKTEMTEVDYPPLAWLGSGVPTYITNGIWEGGRDNSGKRYRYNPDLLPLNESLESITLEESIRLQFSKAMRIEFYPEGEQPSVMLLVFENIAAISAYNDLLDIASHVTTFLKIEETVDNKITISFIDAAEDFHITVPNLIYNKEELKEFKKTLGKNKSFAFSLGLNNSKGERPTLISTKPEFEIITLAGFME